MSSSPESFSSPAPSWTRPSRPEVSAERWAGVQLLACDVDGVLTDGSLAFDEAGHLIQTFNARDGFGLVAARRAGIKVAWVSGRASKVAQKRFDELGLDHCLLACADKAKALRDLQAQLNIEPAACCFIGDDVPDLSAFSVCGLNVAVADAEPIVISRADYVTRARGGRGAVREIIDKMLTASGYFDAMIDMFERPDKPDPENLQK